MNNSPDPLTMASSCCPVEAAHRAGADHGDHHHVGDEKARKDAAMSAGRLENDSVSATPPTSAVKVASATGYPLGLVRPKISPRLNGRSTANHCPPLAARPGAKGAPADEGEIGAADAAEQVEHHRPHHMRAHQCDQRERGPQRVAGQMTDDEAGAGAPPPARPPMPRSAMNAGPGMTT